MAAARVRESCGIPGTSVQTAFLCRDKPAMKEALRAAGVPCAQSIGSADSGRDQGRSPSSVGFPLIVKPRDAAGASGTDPRRQRAASSTPRSSRPASTRAAASPSRSSSRATRASTTRSPSSGKRHPRLRRRTTTRTCSRRCARAGSRRSSSRRTASTQPSYDELKEMGQKVVTRARHRDLGHAHGVVLRAEGPQVQRDRLPSAGRARMGPLRGGQRVRHLPRVGDGGRARQARARRLSRRFSAGIIALRPDRDGHITRYDGMDESARRFDGMIIDSALPPEGTPTQRVDAGYMANAWLRMKHYDYDKLRSMLDVVGQTCGCAHHERSDGTATSDGVVGCAPSSRRAPPLISAIARRRSSRRATIRSDARRSGGGARRRGPIAAITAGWQEREEEDDELARCTSAGGR